MPRNPAAVFMLKAAPRRLAGTWVASQLNSAGTKQPGAPLAPRPNPANTALAPIIQGFDVHAVAKNAIPVASSYPTSSRLQPNLSLAGPTAKLSSAPSTKLPPSNVPMADPVQCNSRR